MQARANTRSPIIPLTQKKCTTHTATGVVLVMLRRRCGDKCEQDQPCQRASRSDVACHGDMRRRCATLAGRGTALMRSQVVSVLTRRPSHRHEANSCGCKVFCRGRFSFQIWIPTALHPQNRRDAGAAMGAEVSGLIPRWDDDSQRQMPGGGEGAGSGMMSMPNLSFDGAGVRRSECCGCLSAGPGGVRDAHSHAHGAPCPQAPIPLTS